MLAVTLAWVLIPLLRRRDSIHVDREASNVAILRDQLRELDADLANGVMPAEQYQSARRELEQRVLEESKTASDGSVCGSWSRATTLTAVALGGALPLAAALIYLALGSPQAFAPGGVAAARPVDAQHDMSPQKMAEMAANLAAKLDKEPDNASGWSTLAHTYYSLQRFPEAVNAYERAAKLAPVDADLLADYADALGAATNGLEGKPTELIQRALKANPTQWKALALAGTVAFNKNDFAQAVTYWERLKASLPADSDIVKSIEGSIADARERGGIKTATALAPAAPSASPAAPAELAAKSAPGATISGTITLSPAFAKTAAPEDTVFVIARATQGPKFPLAIVRKQVKDLPFEFALDDSMAMSADARMSNFAQIIVVARVTKSGNATAQSGDLEGSSMPVKLGAARVVVVIDTPRQ